MELEPWRRSLGLGEGLEPWRGNWGLGKEIGALASELRPWRWNWSLGEGLVALANGASNVHNMPDCSHKRHHVQMCPRSNRHVGVVQTPWGHRRMWRLVFCLQLLVYIDRRGRLSANGQ